MLGFVLALLASAPFVGLLKLRLWNLFAAMRQGGRNCCGYSFSWLLLLLFGLVVAGALCNRVRAG